MKFAVMFALVAFVAVCAAEEFKCEKNVPYIENECNTCVCGAAGGLGCTYKACFSPRNEELQNCKVGTTFEKDCNKCWCAKDLGTICTNNKC